MRPRAAVFAFHDVVPAARLAGVPPTHRPYALDPREFRAHLLAAADSPRRAVAVSRVPGELGGGFFSLTFDDGTASSASVPPSSSSRPASTGPVRSPGRSCARCSPPAWRSAATR